MRPARPTASAPPPLLALLLLGAFVAPPLAADEWSVDADRSLFAVLTHRAGIGARLAHDHLIVARGASAELSFDGADPATAAFRFSVPALALDVDPTAERAQLAPRLRELGVLAGELPEIDADDRADVREAMLGASQLGAERFPTVSAELVALERRGGGAGARVALGWDARVRVSLHGRTVERAFPTRWELADGGLDAEALGEFRFTEFGIDPYSALLGAIRNDDLFHVYVRIVARPATEEPPAGAP